MRDSEEAMELVRLLVWSVNPGLALRLVRLTIGRSLPFVLVTRQRFATDRSFETSVLISLSYT
jgi:hypothetical protein